MERTFEHLSVQITNLYERKVLTEKKYSATSCLSCLCFYVEI